MGAIRLIRGRLFCERSSSIDDGGLNMARSDSGKTARWVGVPLAVAALAAGAAAAYVLVSRRRALIADGLTAPCEDEVSLYMVGEDASAEWADAYIDAPGAAAAADAASDERSVGEDADRDDGLERTRRNRLIDIEGIGTVHADTLAGLGLRTTADLLRAGADPKGREELSAATGISKKLVLRWVNQADLFRIKGVGEQYADLLEAAGVDTVPELAQRRADNLTTKMNEVNDQKRLVRRTPTEAQVAAWIESAKGLRRVVTY